MREMVAGQPGWTAVLGAYLVFVIGLLFTVIVSSGSVARSGTIVGLLAVSLPALVAWLYIESTAWMGPEPMCRIVRIAAITIALTCSLAGLVLTIWSFSRLAAFLVLIQGPLWYLAISAVMYTRDEPDSEADSGT
ncbi:MAG TPA: hypothetical protein VFT36_01615 [Methylomirabilota bacterium]|nr:hypothetical protein [Methylomirabilota bacterium]